MSGSLPEMIEECFPCPTTSVCLLSHKKSSTGHQDFVFYLAARLRRLSSSLCISHSPILAFPSQKGWHISQLNNTMEPRDEEEILR